MLHNLEWLEPGQPFPPLREVDRITRYKENELLFDGEHFGDKLRRRNGAQEAVSVYERCSDKICRVIGNFDEVVSFPVLLNYQRLMSVKMADLVCGEYPVISGAESGATKLLAELRDYIDFDEKLYSSVIDISRYGDAVWRMYLDWSGRKTFTVWDPKEWYPIVSQDGTRTIVAHVLCWRENKTKTADDLPPDWRLHAQIHWCEPDKVGTYEQREYQMDGGGSKIMQLLRSETVNTGLSRCAVFNLKAFGTTSSIYGYDDYMPLDSLLAEIMGRIGQISVILDKHADPNITGPVSMLQQDPRTGEYYLKRGKFFATSVGENEPKYMTWDGQLTAAFSQLDVLINQLYILSEMGAAVLGGADSSVTAISGTAMRFKMVNPLAKARRIANSMTRPVKQLFSELSTDSDADAASEVELPISDQKISIFWSDGLPSDPRESAELCKLATGEEKMMPLKVGIREYFGRSEEEAERWVEEIKQAKLESMMREVMVSADVGDGKLFEEKPVNHPGPQDGTGINPQKLGSITGLNDFGSLYEEQDDLGS